MKWVQVGFSRGIHNPWGSGVGVYGGRGRGQNICTLEMILTRYKEKLNNALLFSLVFGMSTGTPWILTKYVRSSRNIVISCQTPNLTMVITALLCIVLWGLMKDSKILQVATLPNIEEEDELEDG
ncbi:hypothetical protein BU15DRAFT_61027 [Melanogaster broomeanus]|nr:hypothetical protein BU15DRAFT_61027 [Melanogaster broomeanus]